MIVIDDKRHCSSCEYNDGNVYTSIPVQYKCKFTNEFHFGTFECDCESEISGTETKKKNKSKKSNKNTTK